MRIWHRDIDSTHAFYINGLLRALFVALTSIFVPLFIYSLKSSLMLVVLYYVIERLIVVFIVFPLSKLIEKIGFRRSIALSVIFLMGYTICLYLAKSNFLWIWIAAICGGIQIPTYWISRDSALSQDIEGKRMGKKLGYLMVLENIASLLGPFAGGLIVMFAGYPTLFLMGLTILFLSVIPLWGMPSHSHKNGVSVSGFWYFLTNGRYLHQAVANFGSAMNDYGNAVIWPLLIFLQGIKEAKLGAVYSGVAVAAILMQYFTGPWFDKLRAKKGYADEGVYGFVSVGVAMAWVGRFFVSGIYQIASLDISRQLFSAIHGNFYADYMHLGGKRMGSIAYWVYMEIIYSLGAITVFGVMAVGIYFGIWKELVMGTIALWSLATIVMARESNL
jgi:hypothetical protein